MHESDGCVNEKTKQASFFLLCFGLSIVLLGWVLSRIDLAKTWQVLKSSDPFLMSIAAIVFLLTNAMIFWRWTVFIKALDLKCGMFDGARWFLIGLFCNLLPLTSVGGDMVRGLGLSKTTGQRPKVFASIVLDRLSGVAGIVITASVSFAFGRHMIESSLVLVSIFLMTAVLLLLAAVLFSRRIFHWVVAVFSFWPRLKDGLMRLHDDIVLMRGKQIQGLETIGISILAQLVLAFEFYLTAKAMHQEIDLVYFVIFSPLACLAAAMPSIGGLGWRELGWVTLLSKVGVSQSVAGGLSLVNSIFVISTGLLGGLFYVATLSGGRLQRRQAGPGAGGPAS